MDHVSELDEVQVTGMTIAQQRVRQNWQGRRGGRRPSQCDDRHGAGHQRELRPPLVGQSASNKDVVYVTEGWTSKETHAEMFASEAARAHLAKVLPLISDDAQYQDEVPVGGKFRG